MADSIVQNKAKGFAVRIINLYKYLYSVKKETVLAKQVLRSGTSIGANLAEAEFAQSHNDYINKNSVSLKEASETKYWIELLIATGYIEKEQGDSLLFDCGELIKMLAAAIKTMKTKSKRQ